MKTLQIIKSLTFIIIGGIFVFIFFRYCNPQQPEIIIKKDTITIVEYKDSIQFDTIIYDNDIINKIFQTDTVFKIDTVKYMINDYFAKVHYLDTILSDSNGLIVISDTIYMNRLLNRYTSLNLINTTKIIQDNKAHLYLGLGSSFNNNINLSLNGYLQKKNHLFGVGFDTEKRFLINYSYKIK